MSLAPMSIVIGETFLPTDWSTSTAAWSWVLPGWFEWIANGYVVQPVVALVALMSVRARLTRAAEVDGVDARAPNPAA